MKNRIVTCDRLLCLLDGFEGKRLTVIGDLIADEFVYGQVARVSREAPVLVLQYRDTIRLPGGAANAANNLLALGSRVTVVGAVGRDEAGRDLVAMLAAKGADTSLVVEAASYSTPVKTRILAGAHHSAAPQQVVRIDRVEAARLEYFAPWKSPAKLLAQCDGVIMSDYGYGVATPERAREVASHARRRSVPILVDSRFRMTQFHGVTSITPNITELEASTGKVIGRDPERLARVARAVLRRQGLRFLLVTLGRFGMTLFHHRRRPFHIPIYGTDEVADVTGAGDTVIAVFALALSCGAAPEEAAVLANYAGGIVVMKRGTATVSKQELEHAVKSDSPD